MRASRAQFLQTRFETHFELGMMYFNKAPSRMIPYAWMARMQFDKAARHSPHRADEIAEFYTKRQLKGIAVSYLETRLKDPSCNHDPAAWIQLGEALAAEATKFGPHSPKHAQMQNRAHAAFDKAALLAQPVDNVCPPIARAPSSTSSVPHLPESLTLLTDCAASAPIFGRDA